MDSVHLIEFIVAREERVECRDLEHDAPDAPDVHFVVVVAVRHEAFWRSVPSRGNVLGIGLSRVDSLARSQIGQLKVVTQEQDVLALKRKEVIPPSLLTV